ncbi:RNase adapter RapZ [Lentilactobacillus laojiaonis]|uniref:RNase adapter RapZ n=1 Tax=Lentilactobacillus laojiaonis TaxID=2883998 RepID=UPI001D09E4D6|nr:RNase adapter RapZ [Lentilactobacillus laojiaonis]UDM31821.1 RNase adapter RapZ [Lentilactobacillus laojiaonis]
MKNNNQFVLITGMSGAGKTVAMQSFEDLGYFCVDNMPPTLFPKFKELIRTEKEIKKIAMVMDLRSQVFYDGIIEIYNDLQKNDDKAEVLFLESSDEKLVSRYKETRRAHPLARNGRIIDGIEKERELLEGIKKSADMVIDTSEISPRDLREKIFDRFEIVDDNYKFHIEVMSFGFKYGVPLDADIAMDVRFLPNPYYDKKMRYQTGLDQDVKDYVMQSTGADEFYEKLASLIEFTLPAYEKEGKSSLTIAIGCTGGQHRSVAMAQRLGEQLSKEYPVNITHRDIEKHKRAGTGQ